MIDMVTFLLLFLAAYIGVSALGFGLYLLISKAKGTSPWDEVEVKDNSSYQLAQKYLPLINLIVWTMCAWVYFSYVAGSTQSALLLGLLWLIGALLVDYIGFVVIKHPLSLDHKGFYAHQFPWIYFTYFAVFIAPLLAVLLR